MRFISELARYSNSEVSIKNCTAFKASGSDTPLVISEVEVFHADTMLKSGSGHFMRTLIFSFTSDPLK